MTTFVLVNSWMVNRRISEILEFILFPPFSLFRDLTERFFGDFDLLLWLICRFLECFGTLGSYYSYHDSKLSSCLQSCNLQKSSFLVFFVNFLKIFVIRFLGRPCLIFRCYETLETYIGTAFSRFPQVPRNHNF